MAYIKTAVSVQKQLFDELEALAREMRLSRSRLYALALEDFVRRHENERMLDQINAAYQEPPAAQEQVALRKMKRKQRRVVEGEW
ncbi:MAG: hypothetical protein WCF84_25780 [Anaerolineae bacterium]